jgi:hypothetical protein
VSYKLLIPSLMEERWESEGGFCATLVQTARNALILKRRDVRVVEGARLENDSGEAHRATSKHFVAQSIQRLAALKYFSM